MHRFIRFFYTLLALASCATLWAQEANDFPGTRPKTGEPLPWEFFVVILGVLFIIFRFFGVKDKTPAPPPPPPPRPAPPPPMPISKPLMVQVAEALGDTMQEVGKNVHVGGKRMSSAGDTETYLMMAKVDKSYIRKEERLVAQERYSQYEERLEKMKKILIGVCVAAGLIIIILLRDFWIDSYEFISTYINKWTAP